MNVLLVIMDALRPDHLGINGYKHNTSPNIDKVAEEGTTFSNCYTTLPRSEPAVTSMLTGLYAHSHGVRLVSNNIVNKSITTLPEILQKHGYKTAFIKPGSIPPIGYGRGFDDFDLLKWKIKNKLKRGLYNITNKGNFLGSAEQRFSTAIDWIKSNINKKFFLVIHTNDLHWPYPVPSPFDHMFDPDYKGSHDYDTSKSSKYTRGEIIFGHANLPQSEINHAIAHYDGGIIYLDSHFKDLLEFLKSRNLYDDTLIIIVSDHGEHFGENGFYFQHGSSLYETSIKTTLIFKIPGMIHKNLKIKNRIQVLDIMPTILDILGIPLIDNIDGESLLPLIKGNSKQSRKHIFCESAEEHFKEHKRVYFSGIKGKWRAMIIDDWKLVYIPHPEKDIFELYNLKDDPKEEKNLVNTNKEKTEEMKKKILEFLKPQSNEGDVKIEDLAEKSRKLLIKAGYLEK